MDTTNKKLTLAEVCALTGVNQRTVRFYIQKGLVDRPVGLRKAAYYTREHVRQLLEIEKWKGVGLTLEGIREVMIRNGANLSLPPPPSRKPGDVRVWSHIWLGSGVELHLDPQEAGLDPAQVRELAKQTATILAELKNKEQ